MNRKIMKKVLSTALVAAMVGSMAGCGASSESSTSQYKISDVNFADLKVGEDYTDLKADLKFITQRTDIIDTVFADYIKDFQTLYPNVTITYEGITDYADTMVTRLTTGEWGDICMIPTTVDKDELSTYFIPYGDKAALAEKYLMLNQWSYEDVVYGIPSVGSAQGVVYNKKVFADAGITELPKTPEDFLAALQNVKDTTDAIPLYTNFAANWTLTAWDAYTLGSATGDPAFAQDGLIHANNPFADRGDMTGPYAVYYTLYNAVARGLTEEDPTGTDWEGSKTMMNNGQIATMVLGSWAVTQMQDAGDNPDDVGYFTFPITVNGKQYASAEPDYNYAINANSSDDNKIAAMLYIKWLTEESNFAYDQGGIPIVKGAKLPEVYDEFTKAGVEFVYSDSAKKGEETLLNGINNESEVGLNTTPTEDALIIEAAIDNTRSLDDIMTDWNERWSAAQDKLGVERVK